MRVGYKTEDFPEAKCLFPMSQILHFFMDKKNPEDSDEFWEKGSSNYNNKIPLPLGSNAGPEEGRLIPPTMSLTICSSSRMGGGAFSSLPKDWGEEQEEQQGAWRLPT